MNKTAALGLSALVLLGCTSAPLGQAVAAPVPVLQAVSKIDLTRYQGRWYQIAYYPNAFQKQCVSGTTADYQNMSNGQVIVTNTCTKSDGSPSQVVGLARLQQPRLLGIALAPGVPQKLEVRFAPSWLSWVPGVWAPYWVIQLADDYRYAVVGEPSRQYLWILSRTPTLAASDRAQITGMLQQQGYDPAKLQEEPQPKAVPAIAP
jgi:apolipoprotein D and lipocalin family protein